ncbi:hypothetical protein LAV78_20210 [Brucella intermedia]|uniref:hypothetical protein n=1 Tax=Brucella intermedia TaxID=94625 RepID=UPI001E580501|nr:hypothetical protein [Brucella intermedia]MCB4920846.1 hypothetical protein [Brucella intermedia]
MPGTLQRRLSGNSFKRAVTLRFAEQAFTFQRVNSNMGIFAAQLATLIVINRAWLVALYDPVQITGGIYE